jgi:heme exporter protein A
LIAFEDVALARGGRLLASGLSFALRPGDAALVTGPNGAGKSTLVRVAAGLLRPAAGRVRRDGRVALLGEGHALDGERRLREALAFWAGMNGGVADLDAVGLGALADVPVRLLSTGQRRRAGLARVAASGAAVWLLDEPANGLDADGVAMLERLIAEHRANGGVAVVATHQPVAVPGAVTIGLERAA